MNSQLTCKERPRIITAEALAAFSEAEKIVRSAHIEAESILVQAKNEAQKICSDGYLDGLNAGKSEAISLILKANTYREKLEREAITDIIAMCMDIVELFIRTYQKENETWIVERIKSGLSDLIDQRAVIVRLSLKDWQIHQDALLRVTTSSLLEGTVKFFPDSEIEIGDCIFESAAGTIDASIAQCINGIKQYVLETESNEGSKNE